MCPIYSPQLQTCIGLEEGGGAHGEHTADSSGLAAYTAQWLHQPAHHPWPAGTHTHTHTHTMLRIFLYTLLTSVANPMTAFILCMHKEETSMYHAGIYLQEMDRDERSQLGLARGWTLFLHLPQELLAPPHAGQELPQLGAHVHTRWTPGRRKKSV